MPNPPYFSRFDHMNIFSEEYRSLSSSLCSFLHSPVTSSLLRPNILLTTLFANTLSPHSSPSVSNQVWHPHKTIGKIIVLYAWIFNFLNSTLEDKRFCTEWKQAFTHFNLLLISSRIFEIFHLSKGTIISLYIMTSSCTLTMRHDHVLSFTSIHF